MNDLRQLHGDHTWDIIIDYVACPKCSAIMENREPYIYCHGAYKRDFICNHCQNSFTISRKRKPSYESPL